MSEVDGKRGPGRPPGTDETPELLIRRELIAHLKLYRRLREQVQKQMEGVERLDADTIGKYMDLLRKGITDLSRPIVATAKSTGEKVQEDESGEELLRQMLGGKER